jgi:hypothetical protein
MRAWVIVCKALFVSAQNLAELKKDQDEIDAAEWPIGVALGAVGAVFMALGLFFLYRVNQKFKATQALAANGKKALAVIKGKDLAANVIQSEAHIKGYAVCFGFMAQKEGKDCKVEVTWMIVKKSVYDGLNLGDEVPVLYMESDIAHCQLEAATSNATRDPLRFMFAILAVITSLVLAILSVVIPQPETTWFKFIGLMAWAGIQLPVAGIVVAITKTMCLLKVDNVKVMEQVAGFTNFTIRHPADKKLGLGFDQDADGCKVTRINDEGMNKKRLTQIEVDDILVSIDGVTGTQEKFVSILKSKGPGDPEMTLEFRRKVVELPDLLNTPKPAGFEEKAIGDLVNEV